jgi:hypothetical protein
MSAELLQLVKSRQFSDRGAEGKALAKPNISHNR